MLSPLLPHGEVLPGPQLPACSAPGLDQIRVKPQSSSAAPEGPDPGFTLCMWGGTRTAAASPAMLGWGQPKPLSEGCFSRALKSQELQDRRGRILPSCIHPVQEQSPDVQKSCSSAPK